MTDEEKEAKSEQLTIIGVIILSACVSVFLMVLTTLMDYGVGLPMIDNYLSWSASPFFLIACVSAIYGIIRWAVHFGMMSAMRQFTAEQLAEVEKNNISFTMEMATEDDLDDFAKGAAVPSETKSSEWKEVK